MAIDPDDFTPEALSKIAPACVECPKPTRVEMVRGDVIYPNRADLYSKLYWLCDCGAYCGCHSETLKALGRPGGKATRDARQAAHAAFDPLWRKRMALSGLTQQTARGRGYKWLGAQLGIPAKECHIGEMTADMARRVVEICARK